jgi:hypothetical protein
MKSKLKTAVSFSTLVAVQGASSSVFGAEAGFLPGYGGSTPSIEGALGSSGSGANPACSGRQQHCVAARTML